MNSTLSPSLRAFRFAPRAAYVGPSYAFVSSRRQNASSAAASENPQLTDGEKRLVDKLTATFSPSRVQVQDVSGGCGTFYAISIKSSAFNGLSTLKQHRLVTQTLKEEVSSIHGFQLKTIADVPPKQ